MISMMSVIAMIAMDTRDPLALLSSTERGPGDAQRIILYRPVHTSTAGTDCSQSTEYVLYIVCTE